MNMFMFLFEKEFWLCYCEHVHIKKQVVWQFEIIWCLKQGYRSSRKMRISKKAKEANRRKILDVASTLFVRKGFEDTTIRDIASDVNMAVGTLFNYFPNKEALAMSMVNDALMLGVADFLDRCNGEESLSEELFLFITSGLQRLRPMHSYIGPVLERSLSPFPRKNICPEGALTRKKHLEIVGNLFAEKGFSILPEAVSEHIYWSLYLGILAFWAKDDSQGQEATLAMIDYSLQLFTQMLATAEPV